MSQLVQIEPPATRPLPSRPSARPPWQLLILAALALWLYAPTIYHLVINWWNDPNYSHGFFVPLFSAFVVWQERHRLARLPLRPSSSGLAIVVIALGVLILGQTGAELFLARLSILLLTAGMIVLFLGWNYLRALTFPLAFLILMIPLPTLIFNKITFPLQLLASRVAANTLDALHVPVLRLGNVIRLASIDLEVAEACSGIRSLMSLTTLAIVYGYLMERSVAVRLILTIAAVPIAVLANGLRIVGTGFLVQYWDPDKAEGFFHTFSGWLVFVVSLLMLYGLHRLLRLIFKEPKESAIGARVDDDFRPPRRISTPRGATNFILAGLFIAGTAVLLEARGRYEIFPPRIPLKSFPVSLSPWEGTNIPITSDVLAILGKGEFLNRVYSDDRTEPSVELFIAYYESQRTGETPHSPQHCLPGSGFSAVSNDTVMLSYPGHVAFPANRYVVSKGDSRKLVLYWFWAHDRGVASEYWAKYYLVSDSIRLRRSDGALVRIIEDMHRGESPEAAQERVAPFVNQILPLLNEYIPR